MTTQKTVNRTLSVAPMMDYTDRYCRYFLRLISKHTLLYTEMVTTGALIFGDRSRFLRFDDTEHPVAFQLGGSDEADLAMCAKYVEDAGYDEVNLNCGCPSDRVQTGNFGACLMKSPELVARCVSAMRERCSIPVTVKNRIGVDDMDSYDALCNFIGKVGEGGCETFIIHARKAWLQGLSPKQNREIPPLMYDRVYQLKKDFPNLEIIINGGVQSLDEVEQHLRYVDGVMMGRQAYHEPFLLAEADRRFFVDADGNTGPNTHTDALPNRQHILAQFAAFARDEVANGIRLNHMTRHILGLYTGQPGARGFRRYISENAWRDIDCEQFFADLRELMTPRSQFVSSTPESVSTSEKSDLLAC